MATPKQVTEPATAPANTVTEPKRLDPRKKVYVFDSRTGRKYDAPVPETHLKIFPHLREVPSKQEGK
ncbi:hypothetical protein [Glutamicibacter sp. FBE19]|uniref:hypothetical protein n=1 Tax=Glutamicibacter sp. FBE19 TaxID=2761534 RepID=UPI00189662EC|nr:hypothetical protein [Glutamicibacter sp. FBE19]MBF6671597.1 hypothetical protein [Glutamicibacter sp. FBE19]